MHSCPQLSFQSPVTIVLTENLKHSWSVIKTVLERFGHLVMRKYHYRHTQMKRLDECEETYSNAAACLTKKTENE